jgi:hypothetical protein
MASKVYSKAGGGGLIHEQTLKSKISCQAPIKLCLHMVQLALLLNQKDSLFARAVQSLH